MKKTLSFLLVGCMLFTMLGFPAIAVEKTQVTVASYNGHIKVDGNDVNFSINNTVEGTTVKSGLGPLLKEGNGYKIIPAYANIINWPNGVTVPHKGNVSYIDRATATIGSFICSPNTPEDTEIGSLKMVTITFLILHK